MKTFADIQLAISLLSGGEQGKIRAWLEDLTAFDQWAVRQIQPIYGLTPELAAIQNAVRNLDPEQSRELRDWLNLVMAEETPEMLAAIDEGIRSLDEEGGVPIAEARRLLLQWIGK